jgi:hypothetical protein
MHINGSKASPHSFDDLRTGLRTGDVIQFAIRREGGDQDLHITAASRPAFVFTPNPPELEFRIDSLRMAILRHADSLRQRSQSRPQRIAVGRYRSRIDSFVTVLEIETNDRHYVRQEHGGSVSVVRTASGRQATITSWSFQFEAPGSPQAFETLVVRTPRTDSLKALILQLRSQIERVTRTELRIAQDVSSLIRPIQTVGDGGNTNPAHESATDRLVELQLLQGVLASRLDERETELRSATRAELDAARANARVPAAPQVHVRVDTPGSVAHVRPITPYLVGRSYLAGARVTDMNEGLSEYFGVSEGVLVTEVVDGTPAAENGFEAGDVIVAVDDEAVRDVSQLRSRLASQWAGVALTVLRQGEQVVVELSR